MATKWREIIFSEQKRQNSIAKRRDCSSPQKEHHTSHGGQVNICILLTKQIPTNRRSGSTYGATFMGDLNAKETKNDKYCHVINKSERDLASFLNQNDVNLRK